MSFWDWFRNMAYQGPLPEQGDPEVFVCACGQPKTLTGTAESKHRALLCPVCDTAAPPPAKAG